MFSLGSGSALAIGVSAIASMAEAQAKAFGDSSILARYEKTRAYRSAAALKAARTRRRNQEDALAAPEAALASRPAPAPIDNQ